MILPPLLGSTEEFCLILRPFGNDGETLVLDRKPTKKGLVLRRSTPFTPMVTLEQVIARSAGRTLSQKAYAMVDQDRKLAPPGPVYLRAPHEAWQDAVTALIRPVIVLPPCDQDVAAYESAVQQAAVLLAKLESLTGKGANIDRVLYYQAILDADRTFVVKLDKDNKSASYLLERWIAKDPPAKRFRKRPKNRIVGAWIYLDTIGPALASIERELADIPPSVRYPRTAEQESLIND